MIQVATLNLLALLTYGPFVPIVKIADDTGPLTGLMSPAIADSGIVVFWSSKDAGGRGIYTGDGMFLRTIVEGDAASGIGNQQYNVSLDGYVAYILNLGSESEVCRGNGVSLGVRLDAATTPTAYSPAAINAFGTVAFVKNQRTVYRSDAGGVPLVRMKAGDVASRDRVINGFDNHEPLLSLAGHVATNASSPTGAGFYSANPTGAPVVVAHNAEGPVSTYGKINGLGKVAFVSGAPRGTGVFVGTSPRIATTAVPYVALGIGGVNARGAVAFWGNLGGERAAFYHDGTTLTKILDTSGPLREITSMALNEGGTWAICGERDSGGSTIYAGNTRVPTFTVIETGSPLFGSTVRTLSVINTTYGNATYLNVKNQIAFAYTLTSGASGIARIDISELVTPRL